MKQSRVINIGIVDRNVVTRKGLQAIIADTNEPYEIRAALASLSELDAFFPYHTIDILIVDDSAVSPTKIARFIKQCYENQPGLCIIVLSERQDREYIQSVVRYGTGSYILKEIDLEVQFLTAIRLMSAKYPFLSPRAAELIGGETINELQPRDKEVLCLLARQMTIKEISTELEISKKTVYRIRTRLKRILGVRNNEMIIDTAREKGMLNN